MTEDQKSRAVLLAQLSAQCPIPFSVALDYHTEGGEVTPQAIERAVEDHAITAARWAFLVLNRCENSVANGGRKIRGSVASAEFN